MDDLNEYMHAYTGSRDTDENALEALERLRVLEQIQHEAPDDCPFAELPAAMKAAQALDGEQLEFAEALGPLEPLYVALWRAGLIGANANLPQVVDVLHDLIDGATAREPRS